MPEVEHCHLSVDDPAVYRIELQGALDSSWAEAVGGLTVKRSHYLNRAAVTTLTGEVADQAALAGILNLAFALGMPLLSVACLGRLHGNLQLIPRKP